jgi:hypothetical protein
LTGGVKDTVAVPLLAVACTLVGGPGGASGTTELMVDSVPFPEEFVANTVTMYVVPLVSPETVIGLVVPVAVIPGPVVCPLLRAVTVYDVNGAPTVGGVKATVA